MPGLFTGALGAVGGGVIGGAVVRLVFDSSQFNAGLTGAQGKLASFGRGLNTVGSSLTRGVTVPLVAAGAVATKMALDFNKAFVQIQTLAAKGGMSIAQMKTQVLSLAKATGQDPTGLANALYNVLSAGKAAASQAFPILTQAAKGAAIGMGDVQDISKVLIATMNAYGPKTISAAQAMDILTQATKDSAANATDLASSLGPVIGVAAQVGVSFKEVAAAIATATNQGISASRAATALRYLITSLGAPAPAAIKALNDYKMSAGDLQRMLGREGLTQTLQDLAHTFDLTTVKGQEAWRALTGGTRGATIANTLVGKSAAQATQEVKSLGNAAGITNQKFKVWGQTITGQNAKALADLKVAAITLGEKLIPIFERVVKAVTDLVNKFENLSPSMQSTILKGLAIAALAGPFLKLGGILVGLAAKFGTLASAAAKAADAGAGAASGGGQLAFPGMGAAGGAGGATATTGGTTLGTVFGTAFIVAAGVAVEQGAPKVIQAAVSKESGSGTIGKVAGFLGKNIIDQAMGVLPGSISAFQLPKEVPAEFKAAAAAANQLGVQFTHAQKTAIQAALASQRYGAATTLMRRAILQTQQALKGQGVATGTALRQFEAYRSQMLGSSQAAQELGTWINKDNGLTQQQKNALAATIGGLYKYGNGLSQAKQGALESAIATGNYSKAVGILNSAVNKLPNYKQIQIKADTSQATGAINSVQQQLSTLHDKTVNVTVSTTLTSSGGQSYKGHGHAAGGIITGQTGFITQAPTYMVGEGSYSTFAGRGAEGVIPLNDRGIGILSKAMQKAGAGHGNINVTINTQGAMDPNQLAASVSRHLARTIREEALV